TGSGTKEKKRDLIMTGRRILPLVVASLLLFISTAYSAEGVTPDDEVSKLYTVNEAFDMLGTDIAGESLDLNSGQLSFRHVDVSIPGNSALPVEFARTLAVDGLDYQESVSTFSELGD